MLDVASLGFKVDSSQLRTATGDLNRFSAASNGAAAVTKRLGAALGLLGAGISAAKILQTVNSFQEMTNAMRVLGNDTQQATDRIEELADMAARTRTPLQATVDLYQRTSIAARELGASQADIMRFTENVGLALAQQGGSAAAASGALMQLGQALASGTVRAEEFNSMMEGAYPLVLAAAKGIDGAAGSVGRLRQMIIAGEVSSREWFEAIMSQTDALEATLGRTVPTISQAMTALSIRTGQLVAAFDSATGASGGLATAIMVVANAFNSLRTFLAENEAIMQRIVPYVTAAAVAYGTVLAVSLGKTLVASTRAAIVEMIRLEVALGAGSRGAALMSIAAKGLTTAMRLLKGALIATGIGALVVLMGEAINQFMRLVKATGGWGNALQALGDLAGLVWQGIVDSAGAIPAGLSGVWNSVRAGFYSMIADLQRSWYNFLLSFGSTMSKMGLTGVDRILGEAANGVGRYLIENTNKASEAAVAAQAAYEQAGAVISEAFAPVAAKMAELNSVVESAEAGVTEVGTAATNAGGAGAAGAKKAAAATKDLLAELHKELDAREALIGLYGDERKRVEALQQVYDKLGDEAGKYTKAAIQGAADRIVAIEKEEEAWEAATQRMESLTDGLADAWGDWLSGGLRDFKGFVSNILGSFKSMISDMIAAAVRAPIGRALGAAMGIGGGFAVPAFAGDQLSTAINVAMGGGGILSKIGTGIGTVISGAMSGFGSVFSGFMSGGLSGAVGAIGSAISGIGTATSVIGGLATAVGAIAAPVAIVAGLFSAFKGKTKELDAGLRITVTGMDALVETFRKTEKSRFFGLSKKTRTSYDAAAAEIADPIEAAIAKMQTGIMDAAEMLGVGASAFEGFAHEIRMSTKDMTDEQVLQHIQEELGGLSDAFADMIPDLSNFAHEGEGAAATLTRLATSLGIVNGALGDLGLALYDASVSGAGAAAAFAELFGSLDNFTQASSAYYQAFYSDAERLARLTTVSTQALRDAGLAVPETREAYRQLVETQNLATEAGREAVALLIQLAPAFDQIFTAAGDAITAAALAAEDAQNVRSQLLNSLMTEAEQAAAQQAKITAVFASLNMTVPTTLAGLRAIIAGLDLTGEAGRDALAKISGIADALKDQLMPAATAARSSARNNNSVAEERERLERQLLQLQGNTLELRRRELDALAPANRALQEMIWRLEDAKAAMDGLTTDNFATLVDYELARARAANSNIAPGTAPAAERKAQEDRENRNSEQLVRMADYLEAVVNNTHRQTREIRDLRMLQEGTVA